MKGLLGIVAFACLLMSFGAEAKRARHRVPSAPGPQDGLEVLDPQDPEVILSGEVIINSAYDLGLIDGEIIDKQVLEAVAYGRKLDVTLEVESYQPSTRGRIIGFPYPSTVCLVV